MLAPPLDPAWLPAIDEVARTVLRAEDRRGGALLAEIEQLSRRYTRRGGDLRGAQGELAARLRFFLPRDLPKIGGPLAELAAASRLPPGPVWRVLDLGAGLGATTLGVSAFARALGADRRLEVLAGDHDVRALDVLRALASRAGRGALSAASVPVSLEARPIDLERPGVLPRGPFELVVLGLVLNELFLDRTPEEAEAARVALVRALLDTLAPDGVLVVLEPALRDTSRALHRLRDALVAAGTTVLAPCVDRAPCPMLARERDWCHEELPLVLPPPLREIAEGAGLRWEGASYAYLSLAASGPSLAESLGGERPARVVGGPIVEKGRTELLLCRAGRVVRLNVLRRDRDEALERASRGAVLGLDREPADTPTVRQGRDVVATPRRLVRA